MTIKHLLLGAAAVLLTGCFTYVPYEHVTPREGDHVTADLTPDGSQDLARLVGPRVGSLRGQVVNADTDRMLLSVSSTTNFDDETTYWKGEEVAVPMGGVDHLMTKKFSVGRTLLVTAAAVGVGLLAGKVVSGVDKGNSSQNGGGGGQNPN